MADNSREPAGSAANAQGQSDGTPKDGKSELQSVLDAMAALNAKMATLATTGEVQGIRSLVDRHVTGLNQKIETIRRSASGGYEEEPVNELEDRYARLEKRVDRADRNSLMARFMNDFPEAREHWADILKIVQDEQRNHLIAGRGENGELDVYLSYRNALNDVLADKFRSAQRTAAEAAAKAQKEKESTRALADLGAGGAEDLPENLSFDDVENMEPEEMEKRGLTKLFPGLRG